jgi:hypothetical protein
MRFWEFTICMFCVLACGDLARAVLAQPVLHLPMNSTVRSAFYVLTLPAMIGVLAVPVYGFFVMPWWQPIVGVLVAALLAGVVIRGGLQGSSWMYLWAIVFAVAGVAVFVNAL